jgi:hypothetical protein
VKGKVCVDRDGRHVGLREGEEARVEGGLALMHVKEGKRTLGGCRGQMGRSKRRYDAALRKGGAGNVTSFAPEVSAFLEGQLRSIPLHGYCAPQNRN